MSPHSRWMCWRDTPANTATSDMVITPARSSLRAALNWGFFGSLNIVERVQASCCAQRSDALDCLLLALVLKPLFVCAPPLDAHRHMVRLGLEGRPSGLAPCLADLQELGDV